jgi:hypothetical protein
MDILLGILSLFIGIGSLVCWIIVLVKMFKDEKILLGILGIICGIITFIYGWVKVEEYQIKKVMIWWTVLIIASIIINGIYVSKAANEGISAIEGMEQQLSQQKGIQNQ